MICFIFMKAEDSDNSIDCTVQSFECQFPNCNFNYNKLSLLAEHIREAHVIHKLFKCLDCETDFENEIELDSHKIRFHSVIKSDSIEDNLESKPMSVETNDGKSAHLVPEMSSRFNCNFDDCEQVFNSKPELISHMIAFHTEKRLITDKSEADKTVENKLSSGIII